ncbi:MAG: hypothetical protein ABL958_02245, partial [Bdellovibrionia bacterium]
TAQLKADLVIQMPKCIILLDCTPMPQLESLLKNVEGFLMISFALIGRRNRPVGFGKTAPVT